MEKIAQPAQDLYTWLEREHTLAYIEDQERYVPLCPEKRTPCSNPECAAVCEGTYCSAACEAADNAVIEAMALKWEAQMLHAGCQRTHYYASREANARVLLGQRQLVAQQRERDGESLAALVCGYRNV
jgi:hypothetical protein